jgi:hypothetical protein
MDNSGVLFRVEGLKSRLFVTFHEVKLDYYAPIKYKLVKRRNGTFENKQDMGGGRTAIVCVIREAFTGKPYTGMAVRHPKEKSDEGQARRLALRRAVRGYVRESIGDGFTELGLFSIGELRELESRILKAYRMECLKINNPDQYEAVMKQIEDDYNARLEKIRLERKRHKYVTRRSNTLYTGVDLSKMMDLA